MTPNELKENGSHEIEMEQVVPNTCPYCEESECIVFSHSSIGVQVECESCLMRGPCVEGMNEAAQLWNDMQLKERTNESGQRCAKGE